MPIHPASMSESSPVGLPPSTSILNELLGDDVTYSYWSTWSSNLTASNLEGVGRVLGNFYSRMGSHLEKYLRNITYRTSSRNEMLIPRICEFEMMFNDDESKIIIEDICEILLISARKLNDITSQIKAFEAIVQYHIRNPSAIRNGFQAVFEKRREVSDVVTFSWKRSGVEYSLEWLYWYKLASRCLSSNPNSLIDATMQIETAKARSLDFSHFEHMLQNCSDTIELLIVLLIIDYYWDFYGIKPFIRKTGFHNVALLHLIIGLVAHSEILYFQNTSLRSLSTFTTFTAYVIHQMLASSQESRMTVLHPG
ncbi:hypothetical protein SCHPADRAFT_936152 [Schizopora paradoxa]|uniref:Uncharacterized protein n=1 Tax=Schizopora paradoxa TaxID=27342 RepID=A0A0H2S3A9_9AGAM|nr:hypothetical protein SCHPADRAFT_936152 [Schizopora paradoxa]